MASAGWATYLSFMTLSLNLPSDAERRLAEIAKRLNVPVDVLAAAAVRDLLARPAEDFDAVARRVLEKNRELYRRLA
jgi:predicted transcriptional regulator